MKFAGASKLTILLNNWFLDLAQKFLTPAVEYLFASNLIFISHRDCESFRVEDYTLIPKLAMMIISNFQKQKMLY